MSYPQVTQFETIDRSRRLSSEPVRVRTPGRPSLVRRRRARPGAPTGN